MTPIMREPLCFLTTALCTFLLFQISSCQLVVPTFNVGTFYPSGEGNARQVEDAVCGSITDRIRRNSVRYLSELVINSNSRITFATADSRVMSSRMKTTLNALTLTYTSNFTILKAWSQYPDSQLEGIKKSLHFEGDQEIAIY